MREYQKDDIIITWDPKVCTHSGKCVKGLPNVFKPKEAPWIQTENATKEEIIRQVNLCPSGAIAIKKD